MANAKILVVEDNPFSRELVVDLLEAEGYTVIQFQDGENFLERVKQERPHVILLDLQLPGVSGLTLAQQLRADPETRGVAILALTAEARPEKRALALEAGFDAYLTKPLDREELVRIIARVLERRLPGNGGRDVRTPLLLFLKKPRVLIVDDNAQNVELLSALMQAEGYTVAAAADGLEALAQVEAAPPDLILLDIMMPGLDGYAVCRRLKERPETCLVPIVLLTALGAEEHLLRGIEAGADDFLTKPFSQAELKARVRSLLKLKAYTDELEHAEAMLLMLGRTVEAKDPYTQGHCERLSAYSVALGRALDLPPDNLMALDRGGALHDLGKIGIPDSILLKPTALSESEWSIMREHPAIGERICLPLQSLKPVLPIIRHHHERWDGSGYPDGLAGEGIPLTARILQVVDIFDALTTARPYKPALSHAAAVRALQDEVVLGWRDPKVVQPFIELVKRGGLPALPQA
ncbi:MAG: response regulator [Acidobacteria bacterium]|nr:response regulator [Acidobacteriota bacterium]